jgi:N-acetylglucosaminyldiphosphoundecaprenol N-acetyl-beta-D-mannosaminyltransferase
MQDSILSDTFSMHGSAHVLGVKVSAVNLSTAVDMAEQAIDDGAPRYVCVAGVHGVMEAQSDPRLMRIFNDAFMTVPDGMPLTWVGRLQGHCEMDRVFGPDLMAALCEASIEKGYRHFLFGGRPGVAEQLREALQSKFPGLRIVGTYTPPLGPLTALQEDELLAQIIEAQPHILWIGISTPRQERFMASHVGLLPVPLMVGVGAAFDFHTGRIRDCAPWVKRAGLQWLHRMIQDPRRLWRRYLYTIPPFLWRIAWQFAGSLRHPHHGQTAMPVTQRETEMRP